MGIYRGPGGTGDAVNDAASEATLVSQLVTQAQESEANAASSATSAGTSATNAGNSATAASTSATNAASSAASALSSKNSAATSEANALTYKNAAATSATNAATSATNAASSASSASTSASTATTQATNASSSASSASTSATNAATSATNAAASATSASNSSATSSYYASYSAARAVEAATSATNAAASASTATTQASTATTQATNASNSASAASTSATNAATSASTATTQAGIATTQATNASNSATSAANAQSAAETARDQTLAAFDSFDDRYLGQKATAPTVDNDGNALVAGALYFNTTTNEMKVYDGTQWLNAYASLSGALLATSNLSDLNNVATARSNLGLGTIATQAASSVAITGGAVDGTTIGATTASSGKFTSLSDSGNLTFTGTGNRITGDFSNGTVANRVMFQSSGTNSPTQLGVIPNGTGISSRVYVHNNSDPTNSSLFGTYIDSSIAVLNSGITGTGTYLPLTMYTGGSERLRIDTSGNVGIGTTDFVYGKLAVAGSISINATGANRLAWNNSGAYLNWIESDGTSGATCFMRFATQNTERMRITSSGNVGIGVTPSSWSVKALEIGGAGSALASSAANQILITANAYYNAGWKYATTATATYYQQTGGTHQWFTAPSGTAGAAITFTQAMTLDASGNVGIGTSSPSKKLDIVTPSGTYEGLQVTAGGNHPSLARFIGGGGGSVDFGSDSLASTAIIRTAGTERMRIDSSGNVGVGTGSPVQKLQVSGGLVITSSATLSAAQNAGLFSYETPVMRAYVGDGTGYSWAFSKRVSSTTTDLVTIQDSGNVLVGITSATSGGAKLQTVDGITFPATAVSSANANTLDDYEEGTFTPVITGTTTAGTGTYSTQVGNYTKIGRLVYAKAALTWSAHTGTGNMTITGLPFTSGSGGLGRSVGSMSIDSIAYTGTYLYANISDSSATINIIQVTTNAGATGIPIDTSGSIYVTICYQV